MQGNEGKPVNRNETRGEKVVEEREWDNNKGINGTKISVKESFVIKSACNNCKYKLKILNMVQIWRQMFCILFL